MYMYMYVYVYVYVCKILKYNLFIFNFQDNKGKFYLHDELVGRLLSVLEASAISSVRLVTLHLCLMVLKLLIDIPSKDGDHLTDHQKKKLERATIESCRQLAKYFKTLVKDFWSLCLFLISSSFYFPLSLSHTGFF